MPFQSSTQLQPIPDSALERVIALLKTDIRAFTKTQDLVAATGMSSAAVRAFFLQQYHVPPEVFLYRERISIASRLLQRADQSVEQVSQAIGYKRLSTFYADFQKVMGLSPEAYRQLGQADRFTIRLPDLYLSWVPLKLLGRDLESLSEQVSGSRVIKALSVDSTPILLHLEWQARAVHCRVEAERPVGPAIMWRVHDMVTWLVGLTSDPASFEQRLSRKVRFGRLLDGRRGLRIPLMPDIFEGLTWAIVGQQVNLAFAYRLRRVLAELCGQPIGNLVAHPTPAAVSRLDYADLTRRQFSRRKAEYLIDTARLIDSGDLPLEQLREKPASDVQRRLLGVRGLGPWSVNYLMMRSLGFADCVPVGDAGLVNALRRFYNLDHRPNAAETLALMTPFAPFRSLATYHLWLTLSENPQ